MALACGQNEGLAFRFRDLLAAQAIDYAQPNVAITGGFTQCAKIAGMAAAFNVSVANGGAWGFHNMHLQAGVANGTLVEHHYLAVELCKQIYRGLPEPTEGAFVMSDRAGARLRAGPRCDPRDREAAAVAGPQQGLKRRGPGMAASPGLSGFSLIIRLNWTGGSEDHSRKQKTTRRPQFLSPKKEEDRGGSRSKVVRFRLGMDFE